MAHGSWLISMSPILNVLRAYPTFRNIWFGAMISAFGDNLAWLAMSWFVLEKTNSGAAVGLVLLCFALPAMLTAPLIGRLLDHYQPRTIMFVDNVARALIFVVIPLLEVLGALPMPLFYALAVISGALAPATQIGLRLLVPSLLPKDDLVAGNSALSLTQQLPLVLSPLIGGIVTARLGASAAIALNGLSFFALCWAIWRLPDFIRGVTNAHLSEPHVELGMRLPFKFPAVAMAMLLSGVFFFTYGPMEVALPLFTKETLKSDAQIYGLMWSVLGVGSVIGGSLTPTLARWPRQGVLLALICGCWGLMQALLGVSTNVWVICVLMFVGGVAWGPYLALEASLIQRNVPKSMHGRVFGARSAWLTPTAPLGTAVGGALLTFMPPWLLIVASGSLCVLAGLVALSVPQFRAAQVDL